MSGRREPSPRWTDKDRREILRYLDADLIREGAEDSELLLTDIQMPVMDGIALALNVARERPDLPIMLMTGYAHQRERAHGLDSLIRDVVQKPFTLAEICSRVRNALDGDGDARRASA